METVIDRLTIEIECESEGVLKKIEALNKALVKINESAKVGFSGFKGALKDISDSVSEANPDKLSKIIDALTSLNKIQFSTRTSSAISELSAGIKELNSAETSNLKSVSVALSSLNEVKVDENLPNVLRRLSQISFKQGAGGGLSEFIASLASLESLSRIKPPKELADFVRDISTHTSKIKASSVTAVKSLGGAFSGFSAISTSNIDAISRSISDIIKLLSGMPQQALTNLNEMTNMLRALALSGKGLKGLSGQITNVTNSLVSGANKGAKSGKTFLGVLSSIRVETVALVYSLRKVTQGIASFVSESMRYIENLNLFNAAMGKYASGAKEYAEHVSKIVGIDPAQWLRFQGIFQTLGTGFGLAADKVSVMSKNLTQLGYDISSFYNTPVLEAMQRVQSAFSGELEPIRRLGYDLSRVRLQQMAYDKGLKILVNNTMNQAAKAQLRYIALMEQVTVVQGDMARTLENPANQLRIFQAQIVQAGRAIGNIFIPALNAILPAAIAAFKVIRWVADQIASLFGFKIPEIDYSGIAMGAGDLEDNLEGAAGAVKKLKDYSTGLDELNILSPDKGTAGAGLSGLGDIFNLPVPEYDFLKELTVKTDKIFDSLKQKLTDIKGLFDKFGLMAIPKILMDSFKELQRVLGGLSPEFMRGVAQGLEILTGALLLSRGLSIPFPLAVALSAIATSGLLELLGKTHGIEILGSAFTGLGVAFMTYKLTSNPLAAAIAGLLAAGLVPLIQTTTGLNLLTPALIGVATALGTLPNLGPVGAAIAGIGAAFGALILLNPEISEFAKGISFTLTGALIGLAANSEIRSGLETVALKLMGLTDNLKNLSFDKAIAGFGDLTKAFGPMMAASGAALAIYVAFSGLEPGVTVALGIVAGAITALGVAATIGFGPVGWIVGVIAGIATAAISAGAALSKSALPEVERFGDVVSNATRSAINPFMDSLEATGQRFNELKMNGGMLTGEMKTEIVGHFTTMKEEVTKQTTLMKDKVLRDIAEMFGEEGQAFADTMAVIIAEHDTLTAEIQRQIAEVNHETTKAIAAIASEYGEDTEAYRTHVAAIVEESAKKVKALEDEKGSVEADFKAQVAALKQISPKIAAEYARQIESIDKHKASVERMTTEVVGIMGKYGNDLNTMTTADLKRLNEILEESASNGIEIFSVSSAERLDIQERYHQRMLRSSAEYCGEMIKQANSLRDETVKKAEESADAEIKALKKLKNEASREDKEYYTNLIKAKENERDELTRIAKETHANTLAEIQAMGGNLLDEIDLTTGKFKTKGQMMSEGLAEGYGLNKEKMKVNFGTTTYEVLRSLRDKVVPTSSAIGADLSDGLLSGFKKQQTLNMPSWSSSLDGVVNKAKETFKISSPSLVFAGIGSDLAEGLGVGFNDSAPATFAGMQRTMSDFSQLALDNARSFGDDFKTAWSGQWGDLAKTHSDNFDSISRRFDDWKLETSNAFDIFKSDFEYGWKKFWDDGKDAPQTTLDGVTRTFDNWSGDMLVKERAFSGSYTDVWHNLWNSNQKTSAQMLTTIGTDFDIWKNSLLSNLTVFRNTFGSGWNEFCGSTNDTFTMSWNNMGDTFGTWTSNFTNDFDSFKTTFTGSWAEFYDGLESYITNLVSSADAGADDIKRAMESITNAMSSAMSSMDTFVSYSGSGGTTSSTSRNASAAVSSGALSVLQNSLETATSGGNAGATKAVLDMNKTVINSALTTVSNGGAIQSAVNSGDYSKALNLLNQTGKYEMGGFPKKGELFWANEAGAELVGSIGSRTAVANNDQIVEGIRGGVADANEAQNNLLREQNKILRAILSKNTSVTLDGRRLSASMDDINHERGVPIVSGGGAFGFGV